MPIRPDVKVNSQRRLSAAVARSMEMEEYLKDLTGERLTAAHIEALREMLQRHAVAWREAGTRK